MKILFIGLGFVLLAMTVLNHLAVRRNERLNNRRWAIWFKILTAIAGALAVCLILEGITA